MFSICFCAPPAITAARDFIRYVASRIGVYPSWPDKHKQHVKLALLSTPRVPYFPNEELFHDRVISKLSYAWCGYVGEQKRNLLTRLKLRRVQSWTYIACLFWFLIVRLVCTWNCGWAACGDGGNPICETCLPCRWRYSRGALLTRLCTLVRVITNKRSFRFVSTSVCVTRVE